MNNRPQQFTENEDWAVQIALKLALNLGSPNWSKCPVPL